MDIRKALAQAWRDSGVKRITARSILDHAAQPIIRLTHNTDLAGNSATVEAAGELQEDNRDLMPAPGHIVIHRFIPGFIDKLQRRFKRITNNIWPELTEQEKADKAEQRERDNLDAALRKQALDAAAIISNALARLGYCNSRETEGRRVIKDYVAFDWIRYSPLVIHLHVDADRLPFRVSITDLITNDVCTNLSASLRVPVRAQVKMQQGFITGLIYIVELGGSMGIPDIYKYSDALAVMAKESPALSIPLGVSENKRPQFRNLADLPHLLIAGQTLGGKSNMMNVIISTLITRNQPAAVRLALIDLKGGGIELGHFEGIDHLLSDIPGVPGGIATDSEAAVMILDYISNLSEERQRIYTREKVKNIAEYNRRHRNRTHARIVLVIDELALLLDRDEQKTRREVLRLIKIIAATARAGGIHIIAATQSPDKSVINNTIKVNIPGRIAFSVPDVTGSILIINTGDAVNLNPAGRAVWKHGTDKVIIQTPLITNADIARAVAAATAGGGAAAIQEEVTPEELITWAINNNNARLDIRTVFYTFGNRIEQIRVRALLESMDNNTYTIDDKVYRVQPGAGRNPRKVVLVE